jgi:hypothetical protein
MASRSARRPGPMCRPRVMPRCSWPGWRRGGDCTRCRRCARRPCFRWAPSGSGRCGGRRRMCWSTRPSKRHPPPCPRVRPLPAMAAARAPTAPGSSTVCAPTAVATRCAPWSGARPPRPLPPGGTIWSAATCWSVSANSCGWTMPAAVRRTWSRACRGCAPGCCWPTDWGWTTACGCPGVDIAPDQGPAHAPVAWNRSLEAMALC